MNAFPEERRAKARTDATRTRAGRRGLLSHRKARKFKYSGSDPCLGICMESALEHAQNEGVANPWAPNLETGTLSCLDTTKKYMRTGKCIRRKKKPASRSVRASEKVLSLQQGRPLKNHSTLVHPGKSGERSPCGRGRLS